MSSIVGRDAPQACSKAAALIASECAVSAVLASACGVLGDGNCASEIAAIATTACTVPASQPCGVVPDVPVALTRASLLEGRDATLEAALAWIDSGGK